MQREYVGQFANLKGKDISEALKALSLVGEARWCTAIALDILAARSWPEIDQIARRVEGVIYWTAAAEIEMARATQEEARPSEVRTARRAVGDLSLWLSAGGESAPPPPDSGPVPDAVTSAEYLATLALWKAWQLATAIDQIASATYDVHKTKSATEWQSAPAKLVAAVLDPWQGVFKIASLSAELATASTLAEEAELLDERIAAAKGEMAAALEDMRKKQHRERSANGGRNKGEAYKPAKDRIMQLYQEGGYTGARSAAAEDIFKKLVEAKDPMPFSRILRTLESGDRAKTRRERKPGVEKS